MSGFPIRPSRNSFGPKPTDRYSVRNPVKEGGADLFDLCFWQISGMGTVSKVATAILGWDGASLTLAGSAEAWDPDAVYLPIVARSAAGTYTVEYAATYPDRDSVAQTTNLIYAMPTVNSLSDFRAVALVQANKRIIDVRVRNSAGTLADPTAGDLIIVEAY